MLNLIKIKSEISNRDMSERPEMGSINVKEYRRGSKKKANPEKLATQGIQDEEKTTKTQHTMCWTPQYSNKPK